ncbi:hypothetical protein [Serratia proteamaculans]|uniref:hypothetical protein n=2 Tax=Serratia proteamaculans TaxID=28151 RepID=UPI0021BD4BF6|nr:hypothetical protein [Serratia proteamaculans]
MLIASSMLASYSVLAVEDLYAGFFNQHDIGVAQRLIVENHKQHNPYVGDDLSIISARP